MADENHICLAYTLTGTHRGDFQGVAPTGKRITVRGVQIGRFEGGQPSLTDKLKAAFKP